MAVFVLDPCDDHLSHPYWNASSYCGRCYVSADSEKAARAIVTKAFAVGAERSTGRLAGDVSPWTRHDFAVARRIEGLNDERAPGEVWLPTGEVFQP